MTQQDIIKILKSEPDKWHTSTEMAAILGCTRTNISRALATLRRFRIVKTKLIYNQKYFYKYKYKPQ
jgi:response regulator of citrate/malate metabolism